MPEKTKYRIAIIGAIIAVTLGIHYGWILEPIFGESHFIHAIHGRLCYVPIVIAASWFGIRGGLLAATAISVLVLPYLFFNSLGAHNLAGELVEIVFYYAIALLTGALVGREFAARRKQQETELQLERSQKLSMVGQMAAGVAHEIKNPIASIKGAIDILCDDNTPENDRAEFRDIVNRETKRIDRTLRDFLEFARPHEPRLEKTDISDTVAGSLRQVEANLSRTGLSVERDIAPDVFVLADREKIHQVMLNLLLNAMEASEPGGRIRVAVRPGAEDVEIRVEDQGKGIDEESLQRIFDPFFTTKSSGSGLGLSIVRNIVEKHHGTIRAERAPDQGTAFIVSLPRYGGAV